MRHNVFTPDAREDRSEVSESMAFSSVLSVASIRSEAKTPSVSLPDVEDSVLLMSYSVFSRGIRHTTQTTVFYKVAAVPATDCDLVGDSSSAGPSMIMELVEPQSEMYSAQVPMLVGPVGEPCKGAPSDTKCAVGGGGQEVLRRCWAIEPGELAEGNAGVGWTDGLGHGRVTSTV